MADTIMWSRSKQVNTNLVIKLNGGSTEGTNLFTYNGSGAKSINITPSSIGAINTAGTGLSKSGTTLNHSNSITAGNGGPTANSTASAGGAFTVPYFTYDAQGHITGRTNRTITLNSNILDRNDIVTDINGTASSTTVFSSKAVQDAYNKLALTPNVSGSVDGGRIEGYLSVSKTITTSAWSNSEFVELMCSRSGQYFCKITAWEKNGTAFQSTGGRLSLAVVQKSSFTETVIAYSYLQHSGGNLCVTEASSIVYLDNGDKLKSVIWTGTAGAKFKIIIYATPLQFFE